MKKLISLSIALFFLCISLKAQWKELSGGGLGKGIYCDNGKVWVIGTDDAIYSFNGSSFSEYPGGGKALDIAVYKGIPYVIGTNNAIYKGN